MYLKQGNLAKKHHGLHVLPSKRIVALAWASACRRSRFALAASQRSAATGKCRLSWMASSVNLLPPHSPFSCVYSNPFNCLLVYNWFKYIQVPWHNTAVFTIRAWNASRMIARRSSESLWSMSTNITSDHSRCWFSMASSKPLVNKKQAGMRHVLFQVFSSFFMFFSSPDSVKQPKDVESIKKQSIAKTDKTNHQDRQVPRCLSLSHTAEIFLCIWPTETCSWSGAGTKPHVQWENHAKPLAPIGCRHHHRHCCHPLLTIFQSARSCFGFLNVSKPCHLKFNPQAFKLNYRQFRVDTWVF